MAEERGQIISVGWEAKLVNGCLGNHCELKSQTLNIPKNPETGVKILFKTQQTEWVFNWAKSILFFLIQFEITVRTHRKKNNSHCNPLKAVTSCLYTSFTQFTTFSEGRWDRGSVCVYAYMSMCVYNEYVCACVSYVCECVYVCAFSFIIEMYKSFQTVCVLAAGYKCVWIYKSHTKLSSAIPHTVQFRWVFEFQVAP
jgi:hypothetical protein